VVQRPVVNDGDDGHARKGRAEIVQQGASRVMVEALGRLVEQQQAGMAQVGPAIGRRAAASTRSNVDLPAPEAFHNFSGDESVAGLKTIPQNLQPTVERQAGVRRTL
jgi:hypothetical protein